MCMSPPSGLWHTQAPYISPRRNDSHPGCSLDIMLCVQTSWFGSVLIDSYQLIESVTVHLPGLLWWDLQTVLHNQDLPEIRWIREWLRSNYTIPTMGKECSRLIFLCVFDGVEVFVKHRTTVCLGLIQCHFSSLKYWVTKGFAFIIFF